MEKEIYFMINALIIFAPVLLVGFWFLSFIVSQIKRGINNVR